MEGPISTGSPFTVSFRLSPSKSSRGDWDGGPLTLTVRTPTESCLAFRLATVTGVGAPPGDLGPTQISPAPAWRSRRTPAGTEGWSEQAAAFPSNSMILIESPSWVIVTPGAALTALSETSWEILLTRPICKEATTL